MSECIWMNGQRQDWPQPLTVADALQRWGQTAERVAVAINGAFVPRSAWAGQRIVAGDRVEVLMPVQGG